MSNQPGSLKDHKCLFHHTEFFLSVQSFCIAVLFTDVLEHFFWHIQHPDDQTILAILVSALQYMPILAELFKAARKRSERFLPVSGARKLLTNRFCVSKQWQFGSQKAGHDHEYSEYVRKNFWVHLEMKWQFKMSGDTIFCSQGPYQRWERLWHTYGHR